MSGSYVPPSDPNVGRRMARVRSQDTTPELLVRKYLFAEGFRYRLHDKKLPGKPDVVLPKYRVVVFVHGCFWHGHGTACSRNGKDPKANADFWQAKFAYNRERDHRNQKSLQDLGWRVLMVWECELRRSERGATLHRLTNEILAEEDMLHESF
jgi:DNA mismatch endonuclease (patch repair protein)